jgi:hypothetical protein
MTDCHPDASLCRRAANVRQNDTSASVSHLFSSSLSESVARFLQQGVDVRDRLTLEYVKPGGIYSASQRSLQTWSRAAGKRRDT